MNDEQLAEAARRLKARTGSGFRRTTYRNVPIIEIEDMFAHEQEAVARHIIAQQMAARMQADVDDHDHDQQQPIACLVIDLVQGPDGIWHLPGANNGNGREDEPGRITRALGFQPEQ